MPYIVKGCKHLYTCMGGSLLFPRFDFVESLNAPKVLCAYRRCIVAQNFQVAFT